MFIWDHISYFLDFVNTLDCINMCTRPTTYILNIMALENWYKFLQQANGKNYFENTG